MPEDRILRQGDDLRLIELLKSDAAQNANFDEGVDIAVRDNSALPFVTAPPSFLPDFT
jgi:hypothetical protein